jgi:undecaprenyl-diphosphatase
MTRAVFARVVRKERSDDATLAGRVIIGTIPICISGLLLDDFVDNWVRSSELRTFAVIATTTLAFGLLLGWADHRRGAGRSERELTVADALWIGVAQAIAPIPGTSRSGVTVTAALFRGLNRQAAAKFSFLLSIPTILLAGGYKGLSLILDGAAVNWGALGIGIVLSAVSAYLCIHLFLKLIDKIGMMPFVAYRVALAAVLVVFCLRIAGGEPEMAPVDTAAGSGDETPAAATDQDASPSLKASGVSRTR